MYFITYRYHDRVESGILHNRTQIIPLTALTDSIGNSLSSSLLDFISIANDTVITQIADQLKNYSGPVLSLSDVVCLAPIPHPKQNILCIGKNYREHVHEIKNIPTLGDVPEAPIYFTKRPTAVTGPNAPVFSYPDLTQALDYEAELAVIIGKAGSNIPVETAEEYIFGYTAANDITARDLQQKHAQWFKGKSLDSFCPMGPVILHKSALPMPFCLSITCLVNGKIRQQSDTSHMIFDIPTLIHDLSQGITLQPGDIILTGTPAGVGAGMTPPCYLQSGDCIEVEIEKIGYLKNTVH